MLRILKAGSLFLIATIILASGQSVMADVSDYSMGPFIVVGHGSDPDAAQDAAYVLMAAKVQDIADGLREGQYVGAVVILNQGWPDPLSYKIKFTVLIMLDVPPGSP